MMSFMRMKIHNFLSIEESPDISFRPGLHFIHGVNRDDPLANSNGSGKSTLTDAICFALFGRTMRGVKGSAVVRRGSTGGACVELDLSDSSNNLVQIVRYQDHHEYGNRLSVLVDGKDTVSQQKKLDTQAVLTKILGFDFEIFSSLDVLTPAFAFLDDGDSKQKALLERILGLESLTDARTKATASSNRLDESRRTISQRKAVVQSKLQDASNRLDETLEQIQFHETKAAQLRAEKQTRLVAIRTKLQGFDKEIKALDQGIADKKVLVAGDAQREDLLIKELEALREQEASAAALFKEAGQALAEIAGERNVLLARRDRAESLGSVATCDRCEQEVPKDHKESVLQAAEDSLKEVEDRYQGTDIVCDQARSYFNGLREECRAKEREITALRMGKIPVEKALRENEMARISLVSSRSMQERESLLLEAELNKPDASVDTYKELLEREKEGILKLQEEEQTVDDQLAKANEELRYTNFWVNGFSPKGLSSFIMDSVVPDFNSVASQYLRELSDGMRLKLQTQTKLKSGETREKFHFGFDNIHGADSFEGSSSGEKRKVQIAAVFGLRHIRQLNKADHNLFVIDEALDHLDATGVEQVMKILYRYAAQGVCVWVVHHHPDLFTEGSRMVVTKQGGVSTVEIQ